MYSNIEPQYYFDKKIFEKEKNNVFKDNWTFFCNKKDVENHNDYVSKVIFDIPIVVHNSNGEVKAFMNVCSHRFSLIQKEGLGNRPMVCPYHGWSYDKSGIPKGIPKKPLFKNYNEQELCELKLTEYELQSCGNLYFIKINKNNTSLKDYLGEFFEEISKLSLGMNKQIDTNKIDINSNWKVIVENTLESYHVNLVHSETFKKLGARGLDFKFSNSNMHSNWTSELDIKEEDPKTNKIYRNFINRKYKIAGYVHYLIYPNLLISSSYGVSFNISTIYPISENKTEFTSYVYMCDYEKNNPIVEFFEQTLIDFNRKVFDEDAFICQQVQLGVVAANTTGVLSLEEKRVHEFQKTYKKQIV
jgi:phenylpropionate dioxygenase-like ring-hydroxylating dioxygenase large terminal subunit